jgi:hypothetical protein
MADGTKIEWSEAISEVDAAYLAGLIDGEGTIYIMRHSGRDGRSTYYPAISIMMTHEGVLRWVADKLQVAVAKIPRKPTGWRDQFSVRIHGKRAITLCQIMLPFLRVKREQAELVQAFPFEERKGRPRAGRALTPEIIAAREELRLRVNALNERGSNG